jgi:hypothetical protein
VILDWVAQAGVFALATAVVFGPGALIGAALGLRRLLLWASAPAISVGVLSLLALVFPFFSVRWEHLSVVIGLVIVAVVAGAIRWWVSGVAPWSRSASSQSWTWGARGLLIAGLVVGGALNAARLMTYIGRPDAISQTNDAVFHLNALRWIAETGSASSLDLTGLVGASSFYPAAWHAIASLVALNTELIPVAVNMVSLVFAALVWPLSIVLFTRAVIARGGAVISALAAALSAALLAFPMLMFEWGVLYPYAVSLAILPAVIAATVLGLRRWGQSPAGQRLRSSLALIAVVGFGLAGVVLSQTSSFLIWALFVVLWASGTALVSEHGSTRPRTSARVLVGAAWIGLAGAWLLLAYLAGPVLWKAYRSIPGAGFDVLFNSHSQLPAAPVMSALLILGISVAVRDSRLRWLVAAWIVVSLLYVVSVATDLPIIKRVLTGPWYGDSFRLAAIVALTVVPLAAIGLEALIRWLATRPWSLTRDRQRALTHLALVIIALAGTISVIVAPVVLLRVAAETDEQSRYTLNDRSYLSTDEFALLRRIPSLVPEDAKIIANPSTGASFAYVLAEREIIPRTWAPPQSSAWDVIAADLRGAADDAAVCDALAAYGNPTFVLDFGVGGTGPGEYLMPGMTDFAGQDGFKEVDREGDASLWQITACD